MTPTKTTTITAGEIKVEAPGADFQHIEQAFFVQRSWLADALVASPFRLMGTMFFMGWGMAFGAAMGIVMFSGVAEAVAHIRGML